MTKILFICHGSICRSPMAKYIMRDKVEKLGRADEFQIESAATSTEELGNPVYPPAKAKLNEHGISCEGYAARQMKKSDYDKFDLIIGMDSENMYYMKRLWKEDPDNKLHLLMEYTKRPGEVSDPWFTRDFEATWIDANEGIDGLIKYLDKKDRG